LIRSTAYDSHLPDYRQKLMQLNRFSRLLCCLAVAAVHHSPGMAAPASNHSSSRVEVPTGSPRATTTQDLRPRDLGGSSYNEFWTYQFQLTGDLQVFLNFSLANLGAMRRPVTGTELAIVGLDGNNYVVAREYDRERAFSFDASRQRLTVLPDSIFFEGAPPRGHRVYLRTNKDGNSYLVDLEFSQIDPGMTWGDGVFRLGREQFGMFIHIPYARVRGTIEVNNIRRTVEGTAYMDHIFQTTYAPRLISGAYRFVSHTREGYETGLYVMPASAFESRVIGFGVQKRGGRTQLRVADELQVVSARPSLGVQVPWQISLHMRDGDQVILSRRGDR
jgi:hypothetical protein